jgi:hypothetical protein
MSNSMIPLSQAALELAASYNQTLRWVMVGQLKGERRDGRWLVDHADLARFKVERAAPVK